MNTEVSQVNGAAMLERVLLAGDLGRLSSEDRVFYYTRVCESVGLNPLTRPFDYLTLNGKVVLYAKRDATDQLRKIHGVSVNITGRLTTDGVHVVTARAKDKTGREDESTGAVTITGLKGDALANALMKAETKAKRRVTLSICGLGMLDETEIETIPASSKAIDADPSVAQISPDFAMSLANKMRGILEADQEEPIIAMRALDLTDELRGKNAEYQAAWKLMDSKERSAWKKYVDLGHKLAAQEPNGHG